MMFPEEHGCHELSGEFDFNITCCGCFPEAFDLQYCPYQSSSNCRRVDVNETFDFFIRKMSTPADEKNPAISNVTLSDGDEKDIKVPKEHAASVDEQQYDFESEEFAGIPDLVRNVVSFEDDPTLPTITFRSVLLAAVFCIIGSIVSQLS